MGNIERSWLKAARNGQADDGDLTFDTVLTSVNALTGINWIRLRSSQENPSHYDLPRALPQWLDIIIQARVKKHN